MGSMLVAFLFMKKYDSTEEKNFHKWLDKLKEKGWIKSIEYQYVFQLNEGFNVLRPKQLKTKVRYDEKPLVKKKIYTVDFKVVWDEKVPDEFLQKLPPTDQLVSGTNILKEGLFVANNEDGELVTYFEVKGSWNVHNSIRIAKDRINWVWDKYKIYIEMVVPSVLFKETFDPKGQEHIINNFTSAYDKSNEEQ